MCIHFYILQWFLTHCHLDTHQHLTFSAHQYIFYPSHKDIARIKKSNICDSTLQYFANKNVLQISNEFYFITYRYPKSQLAKQQRALWNENRTGPHDQHEFDGGSTLSFTLFPFLLVHLIMAGVIIPTASQPPYHLAFLWFPAPPSVLAPRLQFIVTGLFATIFYLALPLLDKIQRKKKSTRQTEAYDLTLSL